MIGLSADTKDEMLATFAGKLFTVALFEGDDEVADAMYQRREVMLSSPTGEGVRYVQNVDVVRFEGFNSRHLVDHWGLVDLNGELRARHRLTDPIEVSSVMDCKFRPGELRIGLP